MFHFHFIRWLDLLCHVQGLLHSSFPTFSMMECVFSSSQNYDQSRRLLGFHCSFSVLSRQMNTTSTKSRTLYCTVVLFFAIQWLTPNLHTWIVVGLEPTSTNVEIRLEDYQKLIGGGHNIWGFICPAVFPQVSVGDCWAIKHGNKVKITSLIVFQLEVQKYQGDHTGVGHVDGPRAVGIVAVLLRVAWTGDYTR